MRIEQFRLYREDVRDLVELTVGKMDLYLVAAALLIDRTMVMICKQNEAFPRWSPEWAVTLNALALASGVFYLLLALWLAMYASISAQSFGTRLLTQFVRLPYATRQQLELAAARGTDYERRNVGQLLRVPMLQQLSAGAAAPGAATAGSAGGAATVGGAAAIGVAAATPATGASGSAAAPAEPGAAGPEGEPAAQRLRGSWDLLPSAMLEHIRLYRRVQLNWQAYDAYARVSLFAGASSLLYCCLYWSLGQLLQNAKAPVSALGVAFIFATVQIMLTRLDLGLLRPHTFFIPLLLGATPVTTTCGMVLYQDLMEHDGPPEVWKQRLMGFCAVLAHLLHATVVALLLKASWPDPVGDDEALLPGKFRSTLYLDVFGWLLNPGVPGTGRPGPGEPLEPQAGVAEAPNGGAVPDLPAGVEAGAGEGHQAVPERPAEQRPALGRVRSVELQPDLVRTAHRLFRAAQELPAQQVRFGGHEAASRPVIERATAPTAQAAATFHTSPPQSTSHEVRLPGERPWRAFKAGTGVILALWLLSVVLTTVKVVWGGWKDSAEFLPHSATSRLAASEVQPAPDSFIRRAACTFGEEWPFTLAADRGGRVERSLAAAAEERTPVRRGPCGGSRPKRHLRSMRLHCEGPLGGPLSRKCIAAQLHSSGRRFTLCRIVRRDGALAWSPWASFTVASGVPRLRAFALAWFGQPGSRAALQVIGRTGTGSLLTLKPGTLRGRRHYLLPESELEQNTAALHKGEQLFFRAQTLLSIQPVDPDFGTWDSCSADGHTPKVDLRVAVWDFATGQRGAHSVSLAAPLTGRTVPSRAIALALAELCVPLRVGESRTPEGGEGRMPHEFLRPFNSYSDLRNGDEA